MNANENLTARELSIAELDAIAAAGVINFAGLAKAIATGISGRRVGDPDTGPGVSPAQLDRGLLSCMSYIFRELNGR
jgi:hypothetical protein